MAKRYCGVRTDKRHLHLYTKPNGIIRKHCSTYCFICAKQSTLFLAKFIDHTHILIILLHSLFGSHAVCCFASFRFRFDFWFSHPYRQSQTIYLPLVLIRSVPMCCVVVRVEWKLCAKMSCRCQYVYQIHAYVVYWLTALLQN